MAAKLITHDLCTILKEQISSTNVTVTWHCLLRNFRSYLKIAHLFTAIVLVSEKCNKVWCKPSSNYCNTMITREVIIGAALIKKFQVHYVKFNDKRYQINETGSHLI